MKRCEEGVFTHPHFFFEVYSSFIEFFTLIHRVFLLKN